MVISRYKGGLSPGTQVGCTPMGKNCITRGEKKVGAYLFIPENSPRTLNNTDISLQMTAGVVTNNTK